MYHQFEINVINAFYNKFWSQFGKFFKRSLIFAFGVWRKNEGFTFLICYLLVINVYCFFDLLLFWWSWYMVSARGIFLMICSGVRDLERFFSCYFVVPISHTRKFRRNTYTLPLPCFSLKNHEQSFFLNHLFLPFISRINRGFYFCR